MSRDRDNLSAWAWQLARPEEITELMFSLILSLGSLETYLHSLVTHRATSELIVGVIWVCYEDSAALWP